MAKLVVTAIVLIAALVLCAAEERGGPSEKTPSGRAGDHAKEKHLEICILSMH